MSRIKKHLPENPISYTPSQALQHQAAQLLKSDQHFAARLLDLSRLMDRQSIEMKDGLQWGDAKGEMAWELKNGEDKTVRNGRNLERAASDILEVAEIVQQLAEGKTFDASQMRFVAGPNGYIPGAARKCLSETSDMIMDLIDTYANNSDELAKRAVAAQSSHTRDPLLEVLRASDETAGMLYLASQIIEKARQEMWQSMKQSAAANPNMRGVG